MFKTMKSTVNERVKQLRTALRLNQVEFANEVGISPSLISKIEVGEKASINTLDAIIKTYSVPEEWILKGAGEMSYQRPQKAAQGFDPATDTLYNELREQIKFLRQLIQDMRPRASANFPTALNGTGFRKKSLRAAA